MRAHEILCVTTGVIALTCAGINNADALLGTRYYSLAATDCGKWLSTPQNEKNGEQWVLGYWTALNVANVENHVVGSRSDKAAILREIKNLCLADRSTQLVDVINVVYFQFQQSGK